MTSQPGLEVVPTHHKETITPLAHPGNNSQDYLDVPVVNREVSPGGGGKTLFGLRKQTFWLIILAIAVVIAAAIGGGLGARVANSKNKSSSIAAVTNSSLEFSTTLLTPQRTSTTSTESAISLPTSLPGSLPSAMNNTALALTSWRSSTNANNLNLRLFYQGESGELRERMWTSGSGWSNDSSRITDSIIARNNTPLTQVSLAAIDRSRRIRIFYLNDQNIICDVGYSNGTWTKGSLESRGFTAGKDSKLAVIPWNDDAQLQVYYQDSEDNVQELKLINDTWTQSILPGFLKTANGSGLVAIYTKSNGDPQVRLYAQTPNHAIVSKDFISGTWQAPYTLYSSKAIPLGTNIAATMVNTGAEYVGVLMVRVYFIGEGGIVRVVTWLDDWSWDPINLVEGRQGGSVAAVDWDANNGRTFFEGKSGTLGELVLAGDAKWNASDFSI